jgi:ferredoxin
MPKIIHQRKKCLGCGACAAICPKFFEINERDGLAALKNSKKVGEDFELEINKIDCIKEAAETCPVQIIKINSN